jgi:hypothetical protein
MSNSSEPISKNKKLFIKKCVEMWKTKLKNRNKVETESKHEN